MSVKITSIVVVLATDLHREGDESPSLTRDDADRSNSGQRHL